MNEIEILYRNYEETDNKTVQEIIINGWFESATDNYKECIPELMSVISNTEFLISSNSIDYVDDGNKCVSELFCFNRAELYCLLRNAARLPKDELKKILTKIELTVRKPEAFTQ